MLPQNFSAMKWHYLMLSKLSFLHLWAFALLGRKLWDTSFGQSAPQSLGPSSKGSI